GGKVECGAVAESNANLAVGAGLDHVAPVNEIADLRLTYAAAGGDIRLHDHGARMLDGDRTRRRDHLSYWGCFEVPGGRLRGIVLRPRHNRYDRGQHHCGD